MKKLKIKNIIVLILMAVCLIGVIYYSYQILHWKKSVDINKKIQTNLDKKIVVTKGKEINVDFNKLKKQNPDTIAYLNVNGTNINYVVVKGKDNEYYLDHNFNKEKNEAGWVFADYKNKFDESDKNIVIYGHNTKDGSMFETLKNVLNKNWRQNDNNLNITLITEKNKYLYQVFSTYSTKPSEEYIQTYFKDNNTFSKFLTNIKRKSIYDYKVELNDEDKILTLTSCLKDGSTRVVLHAKLIKDKQG